MGWVVVGKLYPKWDMAFSVYVGYNHNKLSKRGIQIMYDMEILDQKAQEVLDIQSLTEQNIDLLDRIIEILSQGLDVCVGIPIFQVFSTIHKTGKSYYDYKMCIRLFKFYLASKNIGQEKREKFYNKNVFGKEKETGYRCIQLLDRLDADEKADLIGKLYVYCIDNEYDLDSYFRICRIVEKCYYDDLRFLIYWKSHETICAKNKWIPQEIIESLYSGGLLSECGIDGGGFKPDDDEGIIYTLNRFGEILLSIIE